MNVRSGVALLCGLACPPLFPQIPASARAGLICFAEGEALVDETPLAVSLTRPLRVGAGQTLRTRSGRAELLLQDRNFLRLDENSAVDVKADDPSSVRVRVLGESIVEIGNRGPAVAVECADATVSLPKPGVYRFRCAPGATSEVMVFNGSADWAFGGVEKTVRRAKVSS